MKGLNKVFSHPNLGLFLMRLTLGIILIIHSVPKFLGGASELSQVGTRMQGIGLYSFPIAWGMFIALAEVVGGVALVLGFIFRFMCITLTALMGITTAYYLKTTGYCDFKHFVYPLTMSVVFFSLALIGPGTWSLERE